MATVLIGIGGMLYRLDPTTFAFASRAHALYFPSVMEVLIAFGYVCLAIAGFVVAVKCLPILAAPISAWHDLVEFVRVDRPEIELEPHDLSNHYRPHFAN
jgi:hypothetical protein